MLIRSNALYLSVTATLLAVSGFTQGFAPATPVAFVASPKQQSTTTTTQLQMGLFDGVKEAFSAPALERSQLDAERETPIDRWMGWSTASSSKDGTTESSQTPGEFLTTFSRHMWRVYYVMKINNKKREAKMLSSLFLLEGPEKLM